MAVACGIAPKGITVTPPISIAHNSYSFPPCHKYGFEWPPIAGNPVCMLEPDPEPSRCPEACAAAAAAKSCCAPAPAPAPCPPAPAPTPCHPAARPCSAPCGLPASCPSTLTSKSMRAALMPYDHQTTIYKLDFCSPPCVRTKVQVPCPTRGAPLGRTAGIIPEYVGTCGGGPIKPQPRRVYGVMGPPPLRYSFGRTEYQAKVGRLGAAILKCRAKRAATCTCLVPYGTAPPCRCVGRGPCRPPCAPAPSGRPARPDPCPATVHLGPCAGKPCGRIKRSP